MTRNRQRKELLQLLLQFPFYDMDEKSISDPNAGYKKVIPEDELFNFI